MKNKLEVLFALAAIATIATFIFAVVTYPWGSSPKSETTTVPTIDDTQAVTTTAVADLVATSFTPASSTSSDFSTPDPKDWLDPRNWTQQGPGTIKKIGNELEIQSPSIITAYTGDGSWHNYTVSIEFLTVQFSSGSELGLIVRKEDECHRYYFQLAKGDAGLVTASLIEYQNCTGGGSRLGSVGNINLDLTKRHSISIMVNGDNSTHIQALLDGRELLNTDDSENFSYWGNIGLQVGRGTVRFRNLSVNSLK